MWNLVCLQALCRKVAASYSGGPGFISCQTTEIGGIFKIYYFKTQQRNVIIQSSPKYLSIVVLFLEGFTVGL
jgi:hypothetical protein